MQIGANIEEVQMTTLFDFMSDEILRASLEADYHELELCMKAGAWKAVHVLAGSIIEAMLLDYLLAINYLKHSDKKSSNLTLFDIINICKDARILSNKTADLSHVVREYRNFIHPEKTIRLGETTNEDSAIVAQSLVRIIIEEISAKRRKNYGYTAEQIVTKVESDFSAIHILRHLLKEIKEPERERLLLRILPSRYFYHKNSEGEEIAYLADPALPVLETCFRLTFESSSEKTKQAVAKEFARVLKEEDSETVSVYEVTFFRGSDLEYFSSEDREMFKEHFLSIMKNNFNDEVMKAVDGLGVFLTVEDANTFVDAFIREQTMMSKVKNEKLKELFISEFYKMAYDVQDESNKRIDAWIATLENRTSLANKLNIDKVKELKEEITTIISVRDVSLD